MDTALGHVCILVLQDTGIKAWDGTLWSCIAAQAMSTHDGRLEMRIRRSDKQNLMAT